MKMLRLLLVVMFVMGIASIVMAEDGIPIKVAITYNLDSNQAGEAIGIAVKENLFGLKGLDADVLIESEIGETLTTDEKNILPGLSYNYDFTEDFSIGAGIAMSGIEINGDEVDIDERDKYIYASANYKF